MTRETQDITKLLFSDRDLTEEEKVKEKLWRKATQEASSLVGDSSPIKLLRKTEEMFREYLKNENLTDENYQINEDELRY